MMMYFDECGVCGFSLLGLNRLWCEDCGEPFHTGCFNLPEHGCIEQEEKIKMKSGIHQHYCPNCKLNKYCPQITHCKKPDESLCLACEYPEPRTQSEYDNDQGYDAKDPKHRRWQR